MARYTVRMVLKKGDSDDYDELYGFMEGEGFTKTISGSDGELWQLPDAEYNYEGSASLAQVYNKAKRAAEGVGLAFSVFVTESAGRKWYGLERP